VAKSLRLFVRAAASPSAPSPRSGEGWGKNAPGEHYKGRRPVDSPAVAVALVALVAVVALCYTLHQREKFVRDLIFPN
jgi:hypothetical protein